MRKKQRNRLMLLLAVCVVGAGAAGGAYWWRQARKDSVALDHRRRGIAALQAEDWPATVDGLGRYLRRFGEDEATGDDYYMYAHAIREVPQPNGQHIAQAIGFYQRSLSLEPGRREAQDELLGIYIGVGYFDEADELLAAMEQATPDDAVLLEIRVVLLERQSKFSQALDASLRLNAAKPDDSAGHLRTLRLLFQVERTAAEIETWVDGVIEKQRGSANARLIRALALAELARQNPPETEFPERARAALEATLEVSDDIEGAQATAVMLELLDGAGRLQEAIDFLHTVGASAPEALRLQIARRLWSGPMAVELPALVRTWRKTADGSVDPEIAVLNALVLNAMDRREDFEFEQDRLTEDDDPKVAAWSAVLRNQMGSVSSDLKAERETIEEILKLRLNSALVHQAQGDVLASLGEAYLAEDCWQRAAQLAPTWSAPLTRLAGSALRKNRPKVAVAIAFAAYQRDPRRLAHHELLFRCAGANFDNLDAEGAEALLKMLEDVRAQTTGEFQQRFQALELAVLARSNPDAALARLRNMTTAKPAIAEVTALRLARIAQSIDPRVAVELRQMAREQHGVTTTLAIEIARARFALGDSEGALDEFDSLRETVDPHRSELTWSVSRNVLLSEIGDPSTGQAWVRLANSHMEKLGPQLGALSCPDAWSDREAVDKIIERVRQLTGEASITWRIARARWLLTDPSGDEAVLAKAASILSRVARQAPDSLEACVLLAQTLERLKNLEGAESQLRRAIAIEPENTAIALEFARVLQLRGDSEEAAFRLEKTLEAGDLSQASLVRAASMLAGRGEVQRGANLVSESVALPDAPRDGVLLLAQLYARLGQNERALALCERLLDRPTANVLQFTASLYERVGRSGDADALLATLDDVTRIAGQEQLIRARHAAAWSPPAEAIAAYRRALGAAAEKRVVWIYYLAFLIEKGTEAQLRDALSDSYADGVEVVEFVRSREELVLAAMNDVRLKRLVQESLGRVASRDDVFAAIEAVVAYQAGEGAPRDVAQTVLELADAHRDVLSLQLLSADLCSATGMLMQASRVAGRAASRFTTSAAIAEQHASILARAGRWSDAADAATVWRERVGIVNVRATALLAESLARADRANEALELTRPLVSSALRNADESASILVAHGTALIQRGEFEEAAALLRDLCERGPPWHAKLLSVDPGRFTNAKHAILWIDQVGSAVDASDRATRLRLGAAWTRAWRVFGDDSMRARAEAVFKDVNESGRSAEALFGQGTLALQNDDLAEAERAFRAVIEIDSNMLPARNNLAVVLANAGKTDEAIVVAEKLVADLPHNAEIADTLALAYRKAGRLKDALSELERAVRSAPARADFQLNLAEVQFELTDFSGVRESLAVLEQLQTSGIELSREDKIRLAELEREREIR